MTISPNIGSGKPPTHGTAAPAMRLSGPAVGNPSDHMTLLQTAVAITTHDINLLAQKCGNLTLVCKIHFDQNRNQLRFNRFAMAHCVSCGLIPTHKV